MPDSPPEPADTAEAIGAAVAGAYFALTALMERIHDQGSVSSGRRAILLNLSRLGPQTVPVLAAMRPVSRQYVQRVTDELETEGLVTKLPNRSHKRSSLIGITAAGEARLAAMLAKEKPVFDALGRSIPTDEAARLVELLERVRRTVGEVSSQTDPG